MPQEIPQRSSEAKFLRHSRASGSFGDPWRSTEIHGDSRRFTEIHGDSRRFPATSTAGTPGPSSFCGVPGKLDELANAT